MSKNILRRISSVVMSLVMVSSTITPVLADELLYIDDVGIITEETSVDEVTVDDEKPDVSDEDKKENESPEETLIGDIAETFSEENDTENDNDFIEDTINIDPNAVTGEWYSWDASTGILTLFGEIPIGSHTYTPFGDYYTIEVANKIGIDATDVKKIIIKKDTRTGVSTHDMFRGMSNLTQIIGLENLNTSNTTDMAGMFSECSSLTSLQLSNFDTSNVTDMSSMFCKCSSLTTLQVSSFDTSNVINMTSMFSGCSSLTSLQLSNFDTSNVEYMGAMFSGCSSLTSLQLSNFDTSNVKNMGVMFSNCSSLKTMDLTCFDTRKVEVMSNMFEYCSSLEEVNLNSFKSDSIQSLDRMFRFCINLKYLDISQFVITDGNISRGMFGDQYCYNNSLIQLVLPDNFIITKDSGLRNVSGDYVGWAKQGTTNIISGTDYLAEFTTDTAGVYVRLKEEDIWYEWDENNGVLTLKGQLPETSYLNSLSDIIGVDNTAIKKIAIMPGTKTGRSASYMFSHVTQYTDYGTSDGLPNLEVIVGLSNLDTSSCVNMQDMFNCPSLTNLDVSKFNTSNVTNMEGVFSGCKSLTSIDLSSFDTSKVNDMRWFFDGCSSLTSLDVSCLDTRNVTNMVNMFMDCRSLTSLDISMFDTSSLTVNAGMFAYCISLKEVKLPRFDSGKIYNFSGLFSCCSSLTAIDLSGFDTSNCTDLSDMFLCCKSLTSIDVSGFDTNKCENMREMFNGCSSLTTLNLSSFDTSSVKNMHWMFCGCSSLTSLDLSGFDTSNVEKMSCMFEGCSSLASLDISGFDTGSVTTMKSMFTRCSSLTSIKLPKNFVVNTNMELHNVSDDYIGWAKSGTQNIISGDGQYAEFTTDTAGEYIRVSNIDIHKVTDWCYWDESTGCMTLVGQLPETSIYTKGLAEQAGISKEAVNTIKIDSTGAKAGKSASAMFYGMTNLKSIEDFTLLDTSTTQNMEYMFYGCSALSDLDLTGFKTANVTSMISMFEKCSSIESLNLSGFDTSNVLYMNSMFSGCKKLKTLDLSCFKTGNVYDMHEMFKDCRSLRSVELSGFDTSKVFYLNSMFYNCQNLISIDLSGFSTANVINMSNMFYGCDSLRTLDLSSFTTKNVTNMENMFKYCMSLRTLDISGFIVNSSTKTGYMFSQCVYLNTLNLSKSITIKTDMYLENAIDKYKGWALQNTSTIVSGSGTYAAFNSKGGTYIRKIDLEKVSLGVNPSEVTYTGENAFIKVTISTSTSEHDVFLIDGTNYWSSEDGESITYIGGGMISIPYFYGIYILIQNDINAGTGTVTITANDYSNFIGTQSKNFVIKPKDLSTFTANLSKTSFEYDGSPKKPDVTVKNGSSILIPDKDYKVEYSDNVNAGEATVTITGKGNYTGTILLTFDIIRITVSSISITPPTKINYFVGDNLSTDGGKVIIKYSDGTSKTVNMTKDMITGFDNSINGKQKLIVTYEGKTASFIVTVNKIVTTAIKVTPPVKTEYEKGDPLNLTGAMVTVTYNNGTTKTVPMTAEMVSNFDNNKIGKQLLTVSYEGKNDTFTVYVKELSVKSITLISKPQKTSYYTEDELDLTGALISVLFENGTSETRSVTSDMIEGYDSTKDGPQDVTIRYGGKTTTFKVTLKKLLATRVSIASLPEKTEYYLYDEIDLSGGFLSVTYNNGKTASVPMSDSDVEIGGFDSSKTGVKKLSVKYMSKAAGTFNIIVLVDPINSPVIVNGVKGYETLAQALKEMTSNEEYEVLLTKKITESTVTIPKSPTKVTIVGKGEGKILVNSITSNCDLILNCPVESVKTGSKPSIKASANNTITIEKENDFGTVSGTKTSKLIIINNVSAISVSTFGNILVDDGFTLSISDKISTVTEFKGTLQMTTGLATKTAQITTVKEGKIILTAGATDKNAKFVLPKLTISNISDEMTILIVDINGNVIDLPSGQVIAYAGSNNLIDEKIIIDNLIEGYTDKSKIKAFAYGKEIKAEFASAMTLEQNGSIIGHFPNFETIFNRISSSNGGHYRIILNGDMSVSGKFSLPSAKNITGITISANKHILKLPGISSLTPKYNFGLENIIIENEKNGKSSVLTINSSSDSTLTLDNFICHDLILKGTKTSDLVIRRGLTVKDITSFKNVDSFGDDEVIVNGKINNVENISGKYAITDAKNGKVDITKLGNCTFRLIASEKINGLFLLSKVTFKSISNIVYVDVTDIDGNIIDLPSGQTVLYSTSKERFTNNISILNTVDGMNTDIKAFFENNKEYKVYFANALSVTGGINGNYPSIELLFSDIESNNISKDEYIITFNNNITASKFSLPKKSGKISIDGNGYKLILPGIKSVTKSYDLVLKNLEIVNYDSKGADVFLEINGKYFEREEIINGKIKKMRTRLTLELENVAFNGSVSSGYLKINGSWRGIVNSLDVDGLQTTGSVSLNLLENKQYKIGTTSNNAAYIFNGKLCITVVNENGQEVVLKNKTIIFTIFDDELDDNITVNNNYGNVQLVKDKLKVIAVL